MGESEACEFSLPAGLELTDADILEAMQEIPGYLDITPRDFKNIYLLAYRHAWQRLTLNRTAATIMTREVVTVTTTTPVAEVAALMGRRGISGVPVVDQERQVLGVISEKDFFRLLKAEQPNFLSLLAACLRTTGCLALPLRNKTAGEIMSAPPVVVRPQTSLQGIAALLATRRINRVPVVDEGGRLVGLVSRGDLMRALGPGEQRC